MQNKWKLFHLFQLFERDRMIKQKKQYESLDK